MPNHRAPGEGSITRRSDGRWQAAVQLDGVRRTFYGRTRSEALAKLKTATEQAARSGGHFPNDGRVTLGGYLADWLAQAKPRLRPKTWERYESVLRLPVVLKLGSTRLGKLTPRQLAAHFAGLSTGARTCQIAYRTLRKSLADAQRWGMIADNPAAAIDGPKAEPAERVLWTPEQARAFVSGLTGGNGGQYGPLFGYLLGSACRLGEACGLFWADVDWQTGTVRIERQVTWAHNRPAELPPKTAAGRRAVALPAWTLELLRAQRARQSEARLLAGAGWRGTDAVFTSETGYTPTPSNVRRGLIACCRRLGLPALAVHSLRSESLSLAAAAGVPLKVLQARAGHSTQLLTLTRYQYALGDADHQAAEALGRAMGDR
jgi:integrase